MKTLFTIIFLCFSLFADADSWTRKADFGGVARAGTFSFSIGNKGYIGTGYDTMTVSNALKDFWEYDPSLNSWSQKADFPFAMKYGIGFSILNKGYAGLGIAGSAYNNLFYEYNPSINTWMVKANYPGGSTYWTVSFAIGDLGYICTGYSPSDELWQYDHVLDIWSLKNNFAGFARASAIGFSLGTKGYVGSGWNGVSTLYNDFWEYDSSTNSWSQKANTPGSARYAAAGFSICNKGYIAIGDIGGVFLNDLWEYDTTANQWTQKTNFTGANRYQAAWFVIGDKAYLGTGGITGNTYFNDFYEYTPDSNACFITNTNDLSSSAFQFQIYPNPLTSSSILQLNTQLIPNESGAEVVIYNMLGKEMFRQKLTGSSMQIEKGRLASGVYFVKVQDGGRQYVQKIVVE